MENKLLEYSSENRSECLQGGRAMSLAVVSAIDAGQNTGIRFVTAECISTPPQCGLQTDVFIGAFITK